MADDTLLPVPVLDQAALRELAQARQLLEHPGLVVRLADAVGTPIENLLVGYLPDWAHRRIDGATRLALKLAMKSALLTLRRRPRRAGPALGRHRAAV
ncbi:MAG: EcsC family protein, partial [Pseudoxanthomonas sp.]